MVFQNSTNQYQTTKYIVDLTATASPYTTIQSAIDAAEALFIDATIVVRAGTYVEDLTLYDGVHIDGASFEHVNIRGVHTPPNSGAVLIQNCNLISTTDIFESVIGGSTEIIVQNCRLNVGAGYIYDLLNWSGPLSIINCVSSGTADGIIDNTGGSSINIISSRLGTGVTLFTMADGDVTINSSEIFIGGTFGGTAIVTIENSFMEGTISTTHTATVSITNTKISTGASEAINHTSANDLTLSDVNIDSTNPPPIEGTGNVIIGSITFLQEEGFAGTLTLDRTSYLDTGTLRSALTYHMGIGAGAQNIVDIIPDTAIGGVTWHGMNIDGSALDPTAANAIIHGISIDFSGVSLANDPEVEGIDITMPNAFSGDTEKAALFARGFGLEVELCSGDHQASALFRGPATLNFDSSGAVAGDNLTGFQYNIIETGSTGGELHVLDVSTTGDGTVETVALGINPGAGVIHQHTGVFGATVQSWKFNGGFTDVTAAFDNPAVDVTIFDGDNDYIYIGSNAVFSQIRALLATNATRNVFPVFEYSIGGPAWTVFSPTDGTIGFTQSGIIEFDSADLAGWASVVVNGANHFYIRIQRTRNNIGTIPIEDTIRILEPTFYSWDDAGDVVAASVTAAGLADTSQTQYEIATYAASGVLDGIGPLTDGQLVIGDTGGVAVAASLASADGSVTITPGAGTIDLAIVPGISWSVETGISLSTAVNSGYITNRAGGISYTLPTTAAIGSIVRICSIQGLWTIAQDAGVSIVFGLFTTTVGAGGTLVATNVSDAIEVVCTVADTTWAVLSSVGNITVN